MAAARQEDMNGYASGMGSIDRRLDGLDDQVEKAVARVGMLERAGATFEVEIKHIAKTLDALLSWVRWMVLLVLGGVISAVLGLVLKMPGLG